MCDFQVANFGSFSLKERPVSIIPQSNHSCMPIAIANTMGGEWQWRAHERGPHADNDMESLEELNGHQVTTFVMNSTAEKADFSVNPKGRPTQRTAVLFDLSQDGPAAESTQPPDQLGDMQGWTEVAKCGIPRWLIQILDFTREIVIDHPEKNFHGIIQKTHTPGEHYFPFVNFPGRGWLAVPNTRTTGFWYLDRPGFSSRFHTPKGMTGMVKRGAG